MEFFFNEIKKRIKEAVEKEFPRIKKELGKEKVYAVAFVTDSDCVTLWLGVNTYEFLEKKDAEYAAKGYGETKWFPSEWGYSDGNSQISRIGVELSEKMGSVISHIKSHADNLSYKQLYDLIENSGFSKLFIETVTSAFLELIQSNVFGFNPDEVTYFISMSDDNRTVEIENNSANVLNSQKVYKEFKKRFEGIE